jgi:hypothetical protein
MSRLLPAMAARDSLAACEIIAFLVPNDQIAATEKRLRTRHDGDQAEALRAGQPGNCTRSPICMFW